MAAIEQFAGKIPILRYLPGSSEYWTGFGARIIRAGQVMHGKTSLIYHNNSGVFKGLKNPYRATRYHSLVICKTMSPNVLEITAWTENPMAAWKKSWVFGIKHWM